MGVREPFLGVSDCEEKKKNGVSCTIFSFYLKLKSETTQNLPGMYVWYWALKVVPGQWFFLEGVTVRRSQALH